MKLTGVTVFPYLYMFLFGVVLQRNFDRLGPLLRGRVAYFFLAYLAAALLLARLDLPVGGNYLNPLSALLLGLTVISAAYNLPTLSNKILRGQDVSYGLYIYHVVVLNVLVARGLTQRWSYLLLALSLSLTLAYLSWMLIERRALGLKAKLTRRDERFDGGDQHASA